MFDMIYTLIRKYIVILEEMIVKDNKTTEFDYQYQRARIVILIRNWSISMGSLHLIPTKMTSKRTQNFFNNSKTCQIDDNIEPIRLS